MTHNITVTKANGDKAPFSPEKVRSSMNRANVPEHLQEEALKHVNNNLREGITTKEIYATLFDYLRIKDKPAAAKYSLKKALMELGPSGFPFEKFIARLYKSFGYKTETNVVLEGECVSHEIDVVAEKDNEKLMIEAKFHNRSGTRTDVQVLLYTYARFLDCAEKHNFSTCMVVTNTKVTSPALHYAECKGIKVLSWNYPKNATLPKLIEQAQLHPVTECVDLSKKDKEELLQSGVVTCGDLSKGNLDDLVHKTNIDLSKLKSAQKETRGIVG